MVDQGTASTSKEKLDVLEVHGEQLDEALIETPGAIGTVERYHATPSLAYERIRSEERVGTTDEKCLDLAVFAINCTVRADGLCAALLVFRSLLRTAKTAPAPTQSEKARLVEFAMKQVKKRQTKRINYLGLRHKGGHEGVKASQVIHQLPDRAPMLVYCSQNKVWEGPFKFILIEGETVRSQTSQRQQLFRSSFVNLFTKQSEDFLEMTDIG